MHRRQNFQRGHGVCRMCLSVCFSVCMYVCGLLYVVCLSFSCVCVRLSVVFSRHDWFSTLQHSAPSQMTCFFHMSFCLSIYLSVCLSVCCLSVCMHPQDATALVVSCDASVYIHMHIQMCIHIPLSAFDHL